MTLNNSTSVHDNTADNDGGGIRNAGTLDLNDSSSVHHNTAGTDGGGIFNNGNGTLSQNGGPVFKNDPDDIAP